MSDFNERIIAEFHANDGRVGGPFAGAHLLLLGTTGAKSGDQRVAPMMYFTEPDGIYVIASKAGSPQHPGWYHNLVADPAVTVEQATADGVSRWNATAEVVNGARRDELYTGFSTRNKAFAAYQDNTTRRIPVVRLTPTS